MNNVESQISRMKAMMSYGLQTENKNSQYKSVEYQRLGADGKTYGIVREGTKFYIKVSDSQKENLLKEDFNYIGGFRNRKNNEYTSYANALKHFDMQMISLKEATGNKTMMVESWNPEKNEYLMVEATDSMKREIARQKQIMGNAAMIMESKSCSCDGCENAKEEKIAVLPKGKGGDIFTEKPTQPEGTEGATTAEKNNIGKATAPKKGKAVKESAEPLAWHKEGGDASSTMADTYLDTSHGTEIGSSAPFDKCPKSETKTEVENGTVEEGKSMAMDNGDNQNSPSVGVGEVGDDAPFDKKVNEAEEGDEVIDDEPVEEPMEDDFEDEGEDFSDDEDFESEEDGVDVSDLEDEDPFAEDEIEEDGTDEIADLKDEIDQLKDMLSVIMDKVGASSEEETEIEFDDDPLYDDDDDMDSETEFELETDDFEDDEDDFETDDFEDDDTEVFESRSYRNMKALTEDRIDYFGKHPAYQKTVMTLPANGEDKNEHGEDWNDESVHGDSPYGQQIGDTAPFNVDPASIDNAIAESVKKIFGKKNF